MTVQPRQPLFRHEVLEHRSDRLHGDISLAMPMRWHVIGYTLLAALAAAGLFLALGSYARVETVSGSIVLDRGVVPIVSHRHGVAVAISVKAGDRVKAGQRLAEISSEDTLTIGGTAPQRALKAMEQQETGLAVQSLASQQAGQAEIARLAAQMEGLQGELATLDRQVAVQKELVASAVAGLETVQDAAKRGFISRRDVVQREESVLTRRQQLGAIEQQRVAKQSAVAEARKSIAAARAQAVVQAATLSAGRAELSQRRIDTQAARGMILTAPVDGMVTAVTANPGQSVGDDAALMTLVPDSAVSRAELEIPTSAIGFLEVGQEVHLAVDAFPYQRFGAIKARIVEISAVTVAKRDGSGATIPVYLATAEMSSPWVTAFGKRHRLLPGMTLSARIVTRRQTLLQWLFEPLFAVSAR